MMSHNLSNKRMIKMNVYKTQNDVIMIHGSISDDLQNVHSTVGFSRAEMEVKGYKIIAYDLGGEDKIRDIWTNYYAEVSLFKAVWRK